MDGKGSGLHHKGVSIILPISQIYSFTSKPFIIEHQNVFAGAIMILASIAALWCAYLSIKRKHFKSALLLATIAPLSYGFVVGVFLSIAAVMMLMLSKHDFHINEKYLVDRTNTMPYPGGTGELSPYDTFDLRTEEKGIMCNKCVTEIDPGKIYIECSCGNTYHMGCGSTIGECTRCGQSFR